MKRQTKVRLGAILGGLSVLGLAGVGFCPTAQAQGAHPKAKVTAAQANAIAVKKYHGHVEGKTALENEEGTWQYGVLVRSGKTLREVMVNAKTGHIDSVEVTTEKKEGLEKKADAAKAKQMHSHKSALHKS